jgi:hypothetical protein
VRIAIALRAVALAIAVAGIVDPVLTLERRVAPRLTIAVLDGNADGVLPDGIREAALRAAERLRVAVSPTVDAHVRVVDRYDRASACPPGIPCAVVAGSSGPARLLGAGSTLMGVVRLDAATAPELSITRIDSPREQHPLAAGLLRVHLSGRGAGRDVRVEVLDGGALVGEATLGAISREGGSQEGGSRRGGSEEGGSEEGGSKEGGSKDPPLQRSAAVDVPWWPIEIGPRSLVVRALASSGDRDEAALGVDVRSTARDVVIYDARPSWASTFVRRAIEGDPRLRIRLRSRVAPELSVSVGGAVRLDASTLAGASVVIVGAPEEVNISDVDLLERFVRVRGGSLILLPDRPLSGPIVRLAPSGLRERLEREPVAMGPLRASELLVFGSLSSRLRALAGTTDGEALVVATPIGEGRVVTSGAMDSWRYRSENEAAFDGFWRSVVAEAADAGGRTLEVTTSTGLAVPGGDVHVEVTRRSMEEAPVDISASALVACEGERPSMVRLWPSNRNRLAGVFTPSTTGPCQVRASLAGRRADEATTHFMVAERAARPERAMRLQRLQSLATAYGAPEVQAGEESMLATAIQGRMMTTKVQTAVSPMHSPWWIVPFVACVGGEWWLRRRQGLR